MVEWRREPEHKIISRTMKQMKATNLKLNEANGVSLLSQNLHLLKTRLPTKVDSMK